MSEYEVGQELRVFSSRYSRLPKSPEEGWPGTVTKVARKYMTVTIECYSEGRTAELSFDMATGIQRGDSASSNYLAHVKTPERVALDVRMKRAREVMALFGLQQETYFKPKFNLEQCEALAELILTNPAFVQEV